MRRNFNLMREILLRLETTSAGFDNTVTLKIGQGALDISGYAPEEIAHHIRIMTEGGFISHGGILEDGITINEFSGLCWKGHKFIEDGPNRETPDEPPQK